MVGQGKIHYVTLTSANIARAFLRALDVTSREQIKRGAVQLVSISPVTSAAIREQEAPIAAEAAEYTTGGVLEALLTLAGNEPKLAQVL